MTYSVLFQDGKVTPNVQEMDDLLQVERHIAWIKGVKAKSATTLPRGSTKTTNGNGKAFTVKDGF